MKGEPQPPPGRPGTPPRPDDAAPALAAAVADIPVPAGSRLQWLRASELQRPPGATPAGLSGPVVVLMPWLDETAARAAARIMLGRAGQAMHLIGIQDDTGQGLVSLLNTTVKQVDSPWIVYTAQDAFAGRYWLRHALAHMASQPAKGLLAFNDGKWFGELAGFGLVRRSWLDAVYAGDLFHFGYRSHYGDTELTLVARQQEALAYHPHALLIEVDAGKDARPVHGPDRELFRLRCQTGFDGRVHDPVLRERFG